MVTYTFSPKGITQCSLHVVYVYIIFLPHLVSTWFWPRQKNRGLLYFTEKKAQYYCDKSSFYSIDFTCDELCNCSIVHISVCLNYLINESQTVKFIWLSFTFEKSWLYPHRIFSTSFSYLSTIFHLVDDQENQVLLIKEKGIVLWQRLSNCVS